jgi:glycerate dehydrogenase
MKQGAFLINTARGPLIVEEDLADSLNEGHLAGAGLDVLSVEPPPETNPLLKAERAIITPHIAWATRAARVRLMKATVENLKAWLEERPQNVVG